MVRRLLVTSAAVLLLAVVITAQAKKPAAGGGHQADETAIRQAAAEYMAAWSAGDAQKLAAVFTDNGVFVLSDGTALKGRPAIEKEFGQEFAGPLKGTKNQVTITDFDFLNATTAVAYGTTEVTGGSLPAGGRKGHFMVVGTKTGGAWKLRDAQSATNPPPATPANK